MFVSFFLSVLLISSFPNQTSSMTLKRHYRRPICNPTQSCSYSFQQFTFELCDCPNEQVCPTDNSVELKGITYQFCSPRYLPFCGPREIAAEVDTLQTSIYCICSPNQIYTKQKNPSNGNVKFLCQEKEICELGQMCGIGNLIIGIKPVCECSENHICALPMLDVFNEIAVQNATCELNL